MLVNCNSCQKKFVVPDSAITVAGRLVQCGSCGTKWTQFPIKEEKATVSKNFISNKIIGSTEIKKIAPKRKKRKISLYTEEYLQKKHGINIKDPQELSVKKRVKANFGFYSYLITLIIFLITVFGVLNLSREVIVSKYPTTESYIYYFYETINILRITFTELLNYFFN